MPEVDFSLYLITDRRQVPDGDLLHAVEAALEGGVRSVQLREKDLPPRDLYSLARQLRILTRRFGARLLVNDRIDVALAAEADGVHLGCGSLPVAAARRLLGPERLLGVSTHTPEEIAGVARDGADFVTFGPVWFTPSKAVYGPPVGLDLLHQAATASPLPVFALGGVNLERVAEALAAGAAGIACISAVLAAADPRSGAAGFLHLLKDK